MGNGENGSALLREDGLLTRLVRGNRLAFTLIFFGLLLVTDNFHTVSDAIYPFLGLE